MTPMTPVRGRLTIREVATGKVIVTGENVTLALGLPGGAPGSYDNAEKFTAVAVKGTATAVTEGVNVSCDTQAS